MNILAAHKRAVGATLFAGTARQHRANLAASIKIENLYCLPVLLSGVPSLVLNKSEVNIIDQHFKNTLKNLIKAYPDTSNSFVLFMAGSLPATAIIHLRQLGLFSMISRLPADPLNARARQVLTSSKPSSKSWFIGLRNICLQYGLPHPLTLLLNPPTKETFKKLAKSKVTDFWEKKLRQESSLLPSLSNFNSAFSSLSKPHPILWTPGSNPYEVAKSVIQCRMLSGRYRTEWLSRHWSSSRSGFCQSYLCSSTPETLEHVLLWCPAYRETRSKIFSLWLSSSNSLVLNLVTNLLLGPSDVLLKFILDPSTHPTVITLGQVYGEEIYRQVFHLTRSWCFALHKVRSLTLGIWP